MIPRIHQSHSDSSKHAFVQSVGDCAVAVEDTQAAVGQGQALSAVGVCPTAQLTEDASIKQSNSSNSSGETMINALLFFNILAYPLPLPVFLFNHRSIYASHPPPTLSTPICFRITIDFFSKEKGLIFLWDIVLDGYIIFITSD